MGSNFYIFAPKNMTEVAESLRKIGARQRSIEPAGAKNGTNVTFTVDGRVREGTMSLYVGGTRKREGVGKDYVLAVGDYLTTVTFAVAPASNAWVVADYDL